MKKVEEEKQRSVNIVNRRAWHEYAIEETFEAGIVLSGTEVKSMRLGKASVQESYCKVENSEVLLIGMHIAPYEQGNRSNVDPLRIRKLLLHKLEIHKIDRALKEKGMTLVPLKIYFTRGYAKLTIGLGRGKKLWDKREAIAGRDVERDKQRELSERG
jgi:SsrA-binding protein